MNQPNRTGYRIDRDHMPHRWPTHRCPAVFWEELGRTIATFGFLEDCLKRANLAVTATRKYDSVEEAEAAFERWGRDLEKSLDDSLRILIKRFVGALNDDDRFRQDYVGNIERKLNEVADWRNALCHGCWTDYEPKSGMATLRHWARKGSREHSDRPICREDLTAICNDVVDITYRVIDAVTLNGIQFPGTEGPGEPAMFSRSK